AKPEWHLLLREPDSLRADLTKLAMPEETRRDLFRLLERARRNRDDVATLRPPLDLVRQLPGAVRARLYRHLIPGTTPAAYTQTIRIASRVPAEEWFSTEDLPEPTRTAVLDLVYPHGGGLAFSDYGALLALLPKEREARLSALRAV